MEIRAYDKEYLFYAQKNLGHMMDFAVNTCDFDLDQFMSMFIVSGIAREFGNGNPTYVVGKTGCEIARLVTEHVGLPEIKETDIMYVDRSPEYWSGWALAYYQWKSGKTFSRIIEAVPMHEIIFMYHTLHEADITTFTAIMDERLAKYYTETNLKRFRRLGGYSQRLLSEESGVPLRQIQLLEQRQRDINKAQAETVFRLAKVMCCSVEDLLE